MIALKPFSVKIGGIAYQVLAGRKIPGEVLAYWQSVKSPLLAEHTKHVEQETEQNIEQLRDNKRNRKGHIEK